MFEGDHGNFVGCFFFRGFVLFEKMAIMTILSVCFSLPEICFIRKDGDHDNFVGLCFLQQGICPI